MKRALDDKITHQVISEYSNHMPKVPLEHVVPVEQVVINKIKTMQQNGHQFMVLTSRNTSPSIVKATQEHLEKIGLDFNQGILKDRSVLFNLHGKDIRFKNGVAMVSGADKGACLKELISALKGTFTNSLFCHPDFEVSFSDDSGSKVDSVLTAMKESGTPCTAWQNRYLDSLVREIQKEMHVADVQARVHTTGVSGSEAKMLYAHRMSSAPVLEPQPSFAMVEGINGTFTVFGAGLSKEKAEQALCILKGRAPALSFDYQRTQRATAQTAANEPCDNVCTSCPPGSGY